MSQPVVSDLIKWKSDAHFKLKQQSAVIDAQFHNFRCSSLYEVRGVVRSLTGIATVDNCIPGALRVGVEHTEAVQWTDDSLPGGFLVIPF